MEVVFLGITDVGLRVYEWLCDREGVEVLAMLTRKEQLSLVEKLQPDIVVSVGYDYIVPPEILSIPEHGCINLHPAYLPYNRGRAPNVWSIIEETPAGVTLHYMDEGIDTGDIIERTKVPKQFGDTGKQLHQRLEEAQFELFVKKWPEIESGEVETLPQNEEGTYHDRQDFETLCELELDEEYTVKEFINRLRALTYPPFDNAFVRVNGEKYYVEVSLQHQDKTADNSQSGLISSY